MRRTLREATADVLNEELPPEIIEKLANELKDLDTRQVADLIAVRLALTALGNARGPWLEAITQLRQLEAPQSGLEETDRPVPEIPDESERLEKVRDALLEAGLLKEIKGPVQ